jgi:hypothetical protein
LKIHKRLKINGKGLGFRVYPIVLSITPYENLLKIHRRLKINEKGLGFRVYPMSCLGEIT